jgi:hypothetical protein
LAKFFLVVGREEKKVDDYLIGLQRTIAKKKEMSTTLFNTKKVELKPLKLGKVRESLGSGLRENLNQVRITGKCQTPLPEL